MYIYHSILLFLFFSLGCSTVKPAEGEKKECIYMLELDKEIDDAFIKKVLIKEKPFNINRASRSKNVWSFTIMGTEAESTSVLNKMKTEPNVLAISTVSLNLNNTQSKSKDMKKVKPTTKQ